MLFLMQIVRFQVQWSIKVVLCRATVLAVVRIFVITG
jgi:hypothetical protein